MPVKRAKKSQSSTTKFSETNIYHIIPPFKRYSKYVAGQEVWMWNCKDIKSKSKNKKGKQGLVTRQYLLRPGYDYTLEVQPMANKNNPFHSMEKSRDHQGSKETSEFRCLPPAHGQIRDLPQTTRIWKQKKMKMFEGNRHVAELWCSLCLATGGQLARCRGCRRVRWQQLLLL